MVFQSLAFYNAAAAAFGCCWWFDFPFMWDGAFAMERGRDEGVPFTKLYGRWVFLLLAQWVRRSRRSYSALVPGHTCWRDACWLQVGSSFTVSVPASPDAAQIPPPFLPFHTRAAGKGHILLDSTQHGKKNLFPSIYNPPLKPLSIPY